MPRSDDSIELYARFIATVADREDMLPFDRWAVARVVDHGARLAQDSKRLSTHFLTVTDLLREADFWARERGVDVVGAEDVEHAIEARIRRMDLARERVHESYERDVILLDTEGEAVGQINALTVVARGEFRFGLPVRITSRARLGGGEVVDIEREVELSGPLHSKGVMILSGFLNGRFLPDEPLSMAATLTFEQSYGGVDGDSASSAELYALLSALSGLPIRQSLAVTGSVNQAGEVQAIGGVNEKIEGFFDICRQRGLTGDQGVLIPASNVQHLMLRADVIRAVKDGDFHVFPVGHVDEGIELLTGVPAGDRDENGAFPPETVNRLVEDRLRDLAERRREFGQGGGEGGDLESS
jgi:predicted ATP-dependent protease